MDELTLEEMDRDNQFHWIRLLFVLNQRNLIINFMFKFRKKQKRK